MAGIPGVTESVDFGAIEKTSLTRTADTAPVVVPPAGGLETSNVAPVANPQQAVVAPTVPNSQVAAIETPAAPVLSPAEQALVEINLGNGRIERLTQAQLIENYNNGLRQADYTRKTQEVAAQRAEVEAHTQALAAAQRNVEIANQLLSNPQLMLQEAQRRLGQGQQQVQNPQQPQFDPNQPMTAGQAAQLAQAFQQRLVQGEQRQAQTIEQVRAEARAEALQTAEDTYQTNVYKGHVNETIKTVLTANPILSVLPEAEDLLRFRVVQMEPKTLEEAQGLFQSIGTEMANQLVQQALAGQQQQQVARANLSRGGIEPPGGGAPQPQPASVVKNGVLDWKALSQSVLAKY